MGGAGTDGEGDVEVCDAAMSRRLFEKECDNFQVRRGEERREDQSCAGEDSFQVRRGAEQRQERGEERSICPCYFAPLLAPRCTFVRDSNLSMKEMGIWCRGGPDLSSDREALLPDSSRASDREALLRVRLRGPVQPDETGVRSGDRGPVQLKGSGPA